MRNLCKRGTPLLQFGAAIGKGKKVRGWRWKAREISNVKVQNLNGIVEWWKNGMMELTPKIKITNNQ